MTGWNLPAGCTQRHIDEAFGSADPSPLQQDVWAILEEAHVPESIMRQIDEIIAERDGQMER